MLLRLEENPSISTQVINHPIFTWKVEECDTYLMWELTRENHVSHYMWNLLAKLTRFSCHFDEFDSRLWRVNYSSCARWVTRYLPVLDQQHYFYFIFFFWGLVCVCIDIHHFPSGHSLDNSRVKDVNQTRHNDN